MGHLTSLTQVILPAKLQQIQNKARANQDVLSEEDLPNNHEIGTLRYRGTGMVNRQYLSVIEQISSPSLTTDIASKPIWIAVLKGMKTAGVWSSTEMTKHICSIIKSNLFGSSNFNKGTRFKVVALPNRQYLCFHILFENQWYRQNGNVKNNKKDWDFFIEQRYQDHNRVSSKKTECELKDRLGVCGENGSSEWMLNPVDFQKTGQIKVSPQISTSRLFTIKVVPPTEKLCFVESRSIQPRNGFFSTELVSERILYVSLLFVLFQES